MAMAINLKIEKAVDYFLFFMLAVKFIFLIAAVGHVITVHAKNPKINQHEELMRKVSDTSEMIFIFGMSLFLIYYFVPSKKSFVVTKETAVLLFAYGIVMLLGALKRYHIQTPRPFKKNIDKTSQPQSAGQVPSPSPSS
jgi:hypothetical protein